MKKVIVIGSSGAGKSTFAIKLHNKTGLPLYHLDMIWHNPDKTHISREEFDVKLDEILDTDEWIIDGDYSRTLERRLEQCDTVFFLDIPLETCLEGVNNRVGKKRIDMPWIATEFDEEFRQYIIDFHKERLPIIYSLLQKYNNKHIYIFKSHQEIDEFIKRECKNSLDKNK